MWYALLGGIIASLAFAIWAIIERSAKNSARSYLDGAKREIKDRDILIAIRTDEAAELARKAYQIEAQVRVVRAALVEARERLAKCGDPKEVQAWLDRELEGGEV